MTQTTQVQKYQATALTKEQRNEAMKNLQFVLNGKYFQEQVGNVLKENRGTFTTSLMEVISGDEKLLQCEPKDLMMESIKAASLKLPLNKQLGQCYLLPFKNNKTGKYNATIVIGTRGFLTLALRTGQYETINSDVVYEGELRGYDKVTGKLDLSGTRTSDTPVGYFSYFKQKDGYSKLLYMSLDEMCSYAKKFSPTLKFSQKITPDTLKQLAINQANAGVSDGVGWLANFEAMALKTTLRRLLSKWGQLSVEMQQAVSVDEAPSATQQRDAQFAEAKEVVELQDAKDAAEVQDAQEVSVDKETGEIISDAQTETKNDEPAATTEDNPFA